MSDDRKYAASLVGIASKIQVMPAKMAKVFDALGGQATVVKILVGAAAKLRDIESAGESTD